MKRLALFMDGTWNDPDSQTNVHRLWEETAAVDAAGVQQLKHYVTGVGTVWHEKIRGGTFGMGLSRKVVEGYRWLVENYQDGDQIFVFGFSRGAYTARSVVGFMSRCGLLHTSSGPISIERLFERYKAGKRHPTILGLKELQSKAKKGESESFSAEDHDLVRSARRVPVEFIGVWDTVGALGIPAGKIWMPWNRKKYYFHDQDLSSLVKHACHAVAIDEHRKDYSPTLWTYFTPTGAEPRPRGNVEQRWFAGAHSNVGGGYAENRLCQVPLAWIASKAADAGLALKKPIECAGDEHLDPVVDSFGGFLGGIYKVLKSRHYRIIDWPATDVTRGTSRTLHETVDRSVFLRLSAVSRGGGTAYEPRNVADWLAAKGASVGTLTGSVRADDPSISVR